MNRTTTTRKALTALATALTVGIGATAAAAKPLDVQVIQTSEASLVATVVLLKGEKNAVLVDVPFTRADAYRVVAEVLDSGKTLQSIIITHDHPDHFFGMDVLKDAFPNVKIMANATVVKDMYRSIPIKFQRWSPLLGANAPHHAVFPEALPADNNIMLEDTKIEVHGPIQGDHVRSTYVWIPDSKTLIAGDILYNGMYVWLGEHLNANYDAWNRTLDELEALKATTIIAGHRKPGIKDDSNAIAFTRQYIADFRKLAATSKTSAELGDKLRKAYPDALDVANNFLVGVSSQVATGEIPPWDE